MKRESLLAAVFHSLFTRDFTDLYRQARSRNGIALIITLIAIVLISVVILAFFSRAQLNRKISFSSSNLVKADLLAQSAADLVTGELREEIRTGSTVTTVSNVSIYTPTAATNMVPVRTTGTGEKNLIRVSTKTPPSAMAAVASSIASTTASFNGRSISPETWGEIDLRAGNVTAATAPQWVLITRSGINSAVSTPDAGNPQSPNYVVGRYAYAIYDEGGLLNINVAGAAAASPATPNIGEKASVAFADLTQVGFTTAQSTLLTSWRNAVSQNDYLNYIIGTGPTYGHSGTAPLTGAAANGFTKILAGDNTFLNRQDLLNYFTTNGLPVTLLSYLGTSSFFQNSPCSPAGSNSSLNPNMAAIISPVTGLPLQRFPLSRFQLLNQDPSKLSTQDTQNILNYFGLTPASGASATYRAWTYRAATVGTVAAAIAAGRDPDLFELVHAAIVNGSLGVNQADSTDTSSPNNMTIRDASPGSFYTAECNASEQVGRIVANMIDQYGTDNYPTTITMGPNNVYGVKHLPYFSEVMLKAYYPNNMTDYAGGGFYIYFELWDPHQGTPPTTGPTNIRIVVDPLSSGAGPQYKWIYTQNGTLPSIDVYGGTTLENIRAAYLPPGGGITAPMLCPTPSILSTPLVMEPPTVSAPIETAPNQPYSSVSFVANNLNFALQYEDGNGSWHTYTNFAGYDTDGGATGWFPNGIVYQNSSDGYTSGPGLSTTVPISLPNLCVPKPDPRTFRFRSGVSRYYSMNQPMIYSGGEQFVTQDFPAHFPNSPGGSSKFIYPAEMYRNDGVVNPALTAPNNPVTVQDNDGTARVGDGHLGNTTSANPMTTLAAAPLILNRAFESVGDLGFVYRDSPWKSLNFFSTDSGDAALLDLFSLPTGATVAGSTSLNTAQPTVLQALLNGAVRDELGTASPAVTPITTAIAQQIAADITGQTAITSTTPAPFFNPGNLATQLTSTTTSEVNANYPAIKSQREAAVRALAAGTDSRTWNLLVDLIAQTGRYPLNPSGLDKFVVEGERHYWLHVAIDRYTGEVVKTQLEPVND